MKPPGRHQPDDLPDPLASFWALAREAAFNSGNPEKTRAELLRQFRSVQPRASAAEFEAARKRLAALCGL